MNEFTLPLTRLFSAENLPFLSAEFPITGTLLLTVLGLSVLLFLLILRRSGQISALRRDLEQSRRALADSQESLEKRSAEWRQEISARGRLEKEFERQSEELDHFVSGVSHDLQEPLRKITSYAGLLQERYKGQLDSRSEQFIAQMIDGSYRAQALVQNLVLYMRIGKRNSPFEPVELGKIIDYVVNEMRETLEKAGATVEVDEMPFVTGNPILLKYLIQNLISNAAKFRGKEAPVIHFSAARQNDFWRISVKDNGIGIDPQHNARIFKIFQRLHTRQEYPGYGIGLAICEKVVEYHGGKLGVDSVPGRGATFFFTLPALTRSEPSQVPVFEREAIRSV